MKIGIIGSGHIGGTLAQLLVGAGHQVAISNSRGPETLRETVAQLGANARAVTAEEAAEFGEVAIVSIPFGRYRQLPAAALTGKIVIDTNNYYPARDGHFEQLDHDQSTGSELQQQYLAGARAVKAFNAIHWQSLAEMGRPPGDPKRIAIPIAADDPEAKRVVAGLIDQIGFDPVDAGTLGVGGRKFQVGSAVYGQLHTAKELKSLLAG
ncbi:MAG: NAD(P)-binding domain-containing protein [Candidatus Dormibacteria bacterium]|jgi:predicted dinucleotide-binding enzyme